MRSWPLLLYSRFHTLSIDLPVIGGQPAITGKDINEYFDDFFKERLVVVSIFRSIMIGFQNSYCYLRLLVSGALPAGLVLAVSSMVSWLL